MKWYTKVLWNATAVGLLFGIGFCLGYMQPKVNNVEITTAMHPNAVETIKWFDKCPKAIHLYGIEYIIIKAEPNELIIEYCDKRPSS